MTKQQETKTYWATAKFPVALGEVFRTFEGGKLVQEERVVHVNEVMRDKGGRFQFTVAVRYAG